jgi:hypothetical protein
MVRCNGFIDQILIPFCLLFSQIFLPSEEEQLFVQLFGKIAEFGFFQGSVQVFPDSFKIVVNGAGAFFGTLFQPQSAALKNFITIHGPYHIGQGLLQGTVIEVKAAIRTFDGLYQPFAA